MKNFVTVALSILLISNAHADDSVVDLSALDSLGTPQGFSQNEPLFPIVKKQPKAPKPVKKEAVKEVVKEELTKVEEIPTTAEIEKDIEETKPVEVATEPAEIVTSTEVLRNDVIEEKTEVIPEPVIVEEPQVEPEPELLIEETPAKVEKESSVNLPNKLVFTNEETELTDADKDIVDVIISGFKDPMKNKINIISYNYDDGQDSFKKKRQSLNRAIEVRTYLLNKGYKNFSIKVINITDDLSKQNTIEIEEVL